MAPLTLERDIRRAIELMETLEQSGEIPASKLAAMKNVLKSDFCRAVREVYEQVVSSSLSVCLIFSHRVS